MPVSIDGTALLRRLEPAVRPVGMPFIGVPVETLDSADFSALLLRAERGEIASGRTLTMTALATPLPPESLSRIAKAMDLLEARGVTRAAILYADRMLIADVPTRSFERELLAHQGPTPVAVEVALRVPTPDEDRPSRRTGPPHAFLMPTSPAPAELGI